MILGCDCNAPETSDTRVMLEGAFTNSAKATGWVLPQPKSPAIGPFYFPQRLDYIFTQGQIKPVATYTIYDYGGSDHYPVLATLEFFPIDSSHGARAHRQHSYRSTVPATAER